MVVKKIDQKSISHRDLYLDVAATSFPKPECVYIAMDQFSRNIGIGSNRGSVESQWNVANIVNRTRDGLAQLLNVSSREVFFTSGATESLNTLILGLLKPGDHVIISPWEHNAVRRPLEYLKSHIGITISIYKSSLNEVSPIEEIKKLINSRTRLILINWVSNVFGLVAPIEEIGFQVTNYENIIFAVDAAQAIGSMPIDLNAAKIDFLAFPGHKALFGPGGIGGFFANETVSNKLKPLKFGGTGIRSFDPIYVDDVPHKYEVGTQNSVGIAALASGLDFINEKGVNYIYNHIYILVKRAIDRIGRLSHVQCYLPTHIPHGIISFNIKSLLPRDVAMLLYESFGIRVRDGFHCAPLAHETAGTVRTGTVRASFGAMHTLEDVDYFCNAVEELAM